MTVDRYYYLVLALCFVALSAVIALVRPDLRRNIAILAVVGAVWGPVSEYWFFQDYWRPLSVVPGAWLEDCLYGAGIAAVAGTAFKVVSGQRLKEAAAPRRLWILPLFVGLYLVAMVVVQGRLHVNSIYVSIGIYVVVTAIAVRMRRDLVVASVSSGLLMAVIALVGYGVGLGLLVDGHQVLQKIWLLDGTKEGTTVFGAVPLTEVLWYGGWGLLLGVAYEFAVGAVLTRAIRPSRPAPGGIPVDDN